MGVPVDNDSVNESKAAEQSQAVLAMFEKSLDGVLLTAPDGRIFAANPAACEMLGRSEEEICAAGREGIVDTTDPNLQLAIAERQKKGRARRLIRFVRADGSSFIADVVSAIFLGEDGEERTSLSFRDVSEQVRLGEELRESEQRFRLLSDAAFEGIAVHENGRIIEVNEAYARLFGYEIEEAIGMQIGDFAAPESRQHVLSMIARGANEPYEYTGIRKDGSRFDCEASGRTISMHGKPARVVAARDISERKRREAEREHFRRRLQEAEKMESLAVLAGGIAHDFNNLLQAMLGNALLAKTKIESSPEGVELLESVIAAIEKAAVLSKQMLAYSGSGRAIVGPLSLNDVILAEVEDAKLDLSPSIELKCEPADDSPSTCADRDQIRQLLRSLIENAAEAIGKEAGTITVRTGVVDADAAYLAKAYLGDELAPKRYAFLEVADDGEGIAKESLPRIFEPFFSTRFQGRGLGLAAALGIVRAHKGAFVVDSKVKRGTTIRALLPTREPALGGGPSPGL